MALQWEYKCGPLTMNLRALMEPKGFLRIIMAFVALLAFAITAGFNSTGTGNTVLCLSNGTTNHSATIMFHYPYSDVGNTPVYAPNDAFVNTTGCQMEDNSFKTFTGSAQFFVAMGVLTLLYVLAAILVYMFFITPELFLAKWIVIGDFFLTILFGVLYLLADIAWSAGVAQLNSFVSGRLRTFAGETCLKCGDTAINAGISTQTYVQPAISLILGYLAAFIWFASVWFVYKDTVWHKDGSGPLGALYKAKDGQQQADSTAEAGGGDK